MSTRLSVFALSAILIASIGVSPIFGQITEPIVVTTDKASYSSGETIVISGQVRELLSGFPVSITVVSPNNNIAAIAQVEVGADRTYSTEITAGGTMKLDGTYTIKVLYGTESRIAETTFDLSGSGIIGGPDGSQGPTFDIEGIGVGYTITGGSLLSITPDVEANSLIIGIDATSDGTLTIDFPREVIDARFGADGCSGEDDDFFVLVDGEEVEFGEITNENSRNLTIDFPAGATEIEIIGTCVIPEFGTIAVLVLAVAIVSIIAVSSRSRLSIMPKY